MLALNDREKRTIGLGAAVLFICLLLLLAKYFETRRSQYRQMVKEAQGLKQVVQPYKDKVLVLKKLMENYHLDPTRLSKASVVAEASSAIQKAAASNGIQFGPIRESPGRPSARELASIKLEGTGPVSAVIAFFHRLDTIGFPVIIESVQVNSDPTKPGMAKLSLTIILMDFDQWKPEETPNV